MCVDLQDIVAAGVHSEIPHGQDRKVYEAILAGEPVSYSLTARRRRKLDMLEPDEETFPAIEDRKRPKLPRAEGADG